MNDVETIKTILKNNNTVAVVGLSSKPTRTSNSVSKYLKNNGYEIIPVNPNEKEVFGEKSYNDLSEIDKKIDTVLIFRRPEFVFDIVKEAVKTGVDAVWMQEGVIDKDAYDYAVENGLKAVMDLCIYKMHIKYM